MGHLGCRGVIRLRLGIPNYREVKYPKELKDQEFKDQELKELKDSKEFIPTPTPMPERKEKVNFPHFVWRLLVSFNWRV